MRFFLTSVLFMAIGTMTFAGQKIDIDFSNKQLDRFVKGKVCVVNGAVLSISGDTTSKNNDWRNIFFTLPFKAPAGNKFMFCGDVKSEKMKGELWIAIRLINADGKSLKYEVYKITKDQDWKIFIKTFTAPPETASMAFYIVGRKMADDSIGSVRNLYIEQLN